MRTQRSVFAIPGLLLMASAVVASASDGDGGFVWTGAQSLNWFETENWLFNGEPASSIPGCGDHENVDISIPDTAGPILVRCPSSSEIVLNEFHAAVDTTIARRLVLNGDSTLKNPVSVETFSLDLDATLLIEGTGGLWDRGTWDGLGFVSICEEFSILGVGSRGLNLTLCNDGVVNMDAGIVLSNSEGIDACIENRNLFRGQGTISRTSAPTATFENHGGAVRGELMTNGTATGPLRFSVPLNAPSGIAVHAMTEDVRISFGGTFDGGGEFLVANNREILIDAQPGAVPMTINGEFNGSGVGQFHIERDITIFQNFFANYDTNSTFGLYLGNSASVVLDGFGFIGNSGKMTWKGGPINGADNFRNEQSGLIEVVGGGTTIPTLGTGTTLRQKGILKQSGQFRVEANARVRVDGGTYEIRSNRIDGPGELSFENSGLLLHPIDAPPGFVEVRTTLDLDNAQIINEAGELRLTSNGLWFVATAQTEANSNLRILGGLYTIAGMSFNGSGEVNVEGNSILTITSETTNNIGIGESEGLFRLGDSNGGEALTGDLSSSTFRNLGDFRLKGGIIDLGRFVQQKGEPTTIEGGFFNIGGTVTTEGPNSLLGKAYHNILDGKTYINHNVQVAENGRVQVLSGLWRQHGAGCSMGLDSIGVVGSDGVWELSGHNSNITGFAYLNLVGGTMKKTNGGISTVSPLFSATYDQQFNILSHLEVESGTLRFTFTEDDAHFELFTRIWTGARIEFPNSVVRTGPSIETVLPEIQGVINLAAGPGDPPTFACDTLILGGRIRPGGLEDAGGLRIEADFEMEDSAIFSINLGGTIAGESHDQLIVQGSAALGGQLAVNLVDDFEPTVGQTFVIATATGGFTGGFDSITGPGGWSVSIDGSDLVLTVDAAPTCAEDFGDNNGSVDVNELLALIAAWGFAPSHPADLNHDDVVDINDLLLLLAAWGDCD